MSSKKTSLKNISFEDALVELENITELLEEGKESLEKSMQLYERGVELKKICSSKLKEAEGKWQVLKKNKNNEIIAEDIENTSIPKKNDLQETMF